MTRRFAITEGLTHQLTPGECGTGPNALGVRGRTPGPDQPRQPIWRRCHGQATWSPFRAVPVRALRPPRQPIGSAIRVSQASRRR
jgi:hypothetical protein